MSYAVSYPASDIFTSFFSSFVFLKWLYITTPATTVEATPNISMYFFISSSKTNFNYEKLRPATIFSYPPAKVMQLLCYPLSKGCKTAPQRAHERFYTLNFVRKKACYRIKQAEYGRELNRRFFITELLNKFSNTQVYETWQRATHGAGATINFVLLSC